MSSSPAFGRTEASVVFAPAGGDLSGDEGDSSSQVDSQTGKSPAGSVSAKSSANFGSLRGQPTESTAVRAMVRVRPFSATELALGDSSKDPPVTSVVFPGPSHTITLLNPQANFSSIQTYGYDHVFWSVPESQKQVADPAVAFATQADVFEHAGLPPLEAVLSGRNACVFAYGQTGSGKTHTMLGTASDPGLIPRIMQRLFEMVRNRDAPHIEVKVQASFLEIYNEKVRDLLDAAATSAASSASSSTVFVERRVRRHPSGGTFVEGLRREAVSNMAEYEMVMKAGTAFRTTAATAMNDQSSRSHAVLQLFVSMKDTHMGTLHHATLNLVDLAGSERVKMSAVSGQQLQEAKNINLSLTTLRRVIDALVAAAQQSASNAAAPGSPKGAGAASPTAGVAPFRESMLTWVLCDSLGGNCVTVMLAACSPHERNIEDTHNTLRYAFKAKAITCHVKVNVEKVAVTVQAIKSEMDNLRKLMDQEKSKREADEAARKRETDELAERETALFRDKSVKALVKAKLQTQVLRRNMELKRKQRELEHRTSLAAESERLARIREETERLQQLAEERVAHEREMQERIAQELNEAQQLAEQLEALERAQKVREENAKLAEREMHSKAFAQIFLMATQSAKEKELMRLQSIRREFLLGRQERAVDQFRALNDQFDATMHAADTLEQRYSASRELETALLAGLAAELGASQEVAVRETRTTMAALGKDISAVQKEITLVDEALTVAYETLNSHIGTLRGTVRARLDVLSSCRETLESARRDLHTMEERQNHLTAHMHAVNARVSDAQTDLDACRDPSLDTSLAQATQILDDLESDSRAIEVETLYAAGDLDSLRSALQQAKADHEQLELSHASLKTYVSHRGDVPIDLIANVGETGWVPPLNLSATMIAMNTATASSAMGSPGAVTSSTPSRPVLNKSAGLRASSSQPQQNSLLSPQFSQAALTSSPPAGLSLHKLQRLASVPSLPISPQQVVNSTPSTAR